MKKTLITVSLGVFVLLYLMNAGWLKDTQPELNEIYRHNFSLAEIEKKVSGFGDLPLDSLPVTAKEEGDVKTFHFELTFVPYTKIRDLIFGEIICQTDFVLHTYNGQEYWIPTVVYAFGMADTQQVKMEITPSFEFALKEDSSLLITQYLWIDLGNLNSYWTNTSETDESGNTVSYSSESRGPHAGQLFQYQFTSKEGALSEGEEMDWSKNFEHGDGTAQIFRQIFGTEGWVIAVRSVGWE